MESFKVHAYIHIDVSLLEFKSKYETITMLHKLFQLMGWKTGVIWIPK